MLALLKTENSGRRGRSCRILTSSVSPLGVPAALVVIDVPRSAGEKHLARALDRCAAMLSASRIRRLLPHRDLTVAGSFFDMGFELPDCRALLTVKAGPILSRLASGRGRFLLCASRAGADTLRALSELAAAFRHVTLAAPPQELRRLSDAAWELGLAPELLGADGMADVDAAAILSPPARPVFLPSRCVYLSPAGPGAGILGGHPVDRVGFSLPLRLRGTLPDGFDPAVLLSEALSSGKLSVSDVSVL